MNILYIYCAVWIAVPLLGLVIATMAGVAKHWRGLMFYLSALIALGVSALFIADPLKMFLDTIDPDFYRQIKRADAGNYFLSQLANYSVLALGMGLVTFIRPHVSVMLVSVQFWLFHLGALISIVPLAWWAMQQEPGPLVAPANPGAWSIIATYGIILILLSVLLLLGLVMWAFWTKMKTAGAKET